MLDTLTITSFSSEPEVPPFTQLLQVMMVLYSAMAITSLPIHSKITLDALKRLVVP